MSCLVVCIWLVLAAVAFFCGDMGCTFIVGLIAEIVWYLLWN